MNVSEKSFLQLLQCHPDLSAFGLGGPEFCGARKVDFAAERRKLESSFQDFAACCDWLLDCTPLKHVSFISPVSKDLLAYLEQEAGLRVSNGILIAAVIHMRIPHHPLPESPDAQIGISMSSPALARFAAPSRQRKKA